MGNMKLIYKSFSSVLQIFLTLLAITSFSKNIYSNGGPIDISNFYKFDRIKLMSRADVKLQKEVLNITINDDWSDIHVLYILTNTDTEGVDVKYGFPVDYFNEKCEDCGHWDSVFIKKFTIKADGKKLNVMELKDIEKFNAPETDDTGNNYDVEYYRRWYVSEFSIPENSSVILEIGFTLKSAYSDYDVFEDDGFLSKYNPRFIRYDLSPARFWGDATIENFTVNIDAKNIANNFGTINIDGIKCNKQEDGSFTYHTNSFEITPSSQIIIKYTDDNILNSKKIEKDLIPKNRINVKCSSELQGNYSAGNLIDNKFSTAWVEGKEGEGIGEWVEFEIKNCEIYNILILNGYRKSKKIYEENSRPGKLQLSIDYYDGKKVMNNYTDTVELKEKEFLGVPGKKNISKQINIINIPSYCWEITKVRMTILDVRKGTKYEDTAISEIFLIGKAKE